jgi:hypothetical protein
MAEYQNEKRAMLVIAHPGHELRVHGWLETARPNVWVLTNGSGRTQHSRIDSTTRVLASAGSVPGPVYGQMSDVDLYNDVLSHNHRRFTELVDRLVDGLIRADVDCVAGDAEEGYNPAHDICRLVINAAVRLVKSGTKKEITNYDFTLVGPPAGSLNEVRPHSIWLALDDAAFARKLSAARNYPELQAEVEAALNGSGNGTFSDQPELAQRVRATFGPTDASSFRNECLRHLRNSRESTVGFNGVAPFYETYGEQQVRAGHYTHVLRCRDHMLPLAMALEAHVEMHS